MNLEKDSKVRGMETPSGLGTGPVTGGVFNLVGGGVAAATSVDVLTEVVVLSSGFILASMNLAIES
jgi:hypothetical protein